MMQSQELTFTTVSDARRYFQEHKKHPEAVSLHCLEGVRSLAERESNHNLNMWLVTAIQGGARFLMERRDPDAAGALRYLQFAAELTSKLPEDNAILAGREIVVCAFEIAANLKQSGNQALAERCEHTAAALNRQFGGLFDQVLIQIMHDRENSALHSLGDRQPERPDPSPLGAIFTFFQGADSQAVVNEFRLEVSSPLIIVVKPNNWFSEHQGEGRLWFAKAGPYEGLTEREAWDLLRDRKDEIDRRHGFGRTPQGDLLPGQRWFKEHEAEGDAWFYQEGPYEGQSLSAAWELFQRRKREIDVRYGARWAT